MGEPDIDPALADMCRREHPRLVGLLALNVGDRNVAEDLAQEALIRLHQHWLRVRTMAYPRGWLSTVAMNLSRSWWRRRYAEQRANRRLRTTDGPAPPAEPADILTVRSAVARLPHRQREALLLRYYAGMTVPEAATAMRCAEGTIKSLTHRAIGALRADLADFDPNIVEPEEAIRYA